MLEAFNIVWLEKLEVYLGITVKSLSGKNDDILITVRYKLLSVLGECPVRLRLVIQS